MGLQRISTLQRNGFAAAPSLKCLLSCGLWAKALVNRQSDTRPHCQVASGRQTTGPAGAEKPDNFSAICEDWFHDKYQVNQIWEYREPPSAIGKHEVL